jgi:hypothetical protein
MFIVDTHPLLIGLNKNRLETLPYTAINIILHKAIKSRDVTLHMGMNYFYLKFHLVCTTMKSIFLTTVAELHELYILFPVFCTH